MVDPQTLSLLAAMSCAGRSRQSSPSGDCARFGRVPGSSSGDCRRISISTVGDMSVHVSMSKGAPMASATTFPGKPARTKSIKHPVDQVLPIPNLAVYGLQHVMAFLHSFPTRRSSDSDRKSVV